MKLPVSKIPIATALAALALAYTAASTPRVAADGGAHDFVVGAFRLRESDQRNVSAHSGPNGEEAKGHFKGQEQLPGGKVYVYGRVVCLNVVGNQASLIYQIERHSNPALEGSYVVAFLEDNGDPGHGVDRADFSRPFFSPVEPACPAPREPRVPFTQGNIVIHDAH